MTDRKAAWGTVGFGCVVAAAGAYMYWSREASRKTILVTGASGYLGQFVVDRLLKDAYWKAYRVVGTTHSNKASESIPVGAEGLQLDGTDPEAIRSMLRSLKPDVIVNCMAISSPAKCEKIKDLAEKLNSCEALIGAVKTECPNSLFIHISTDQVFSGKGGTETVAEPKSYGGYTESSDPQPVNWYGRTKLLAENNCKALLKQNYIILRASGIYGPPPPRKCKKTGTFLQMVVKMLAAEGKSPFFTEELRSMVYVDDCVDAITHFIEDYSPNHKKDKRDQNWGHTDKIYHMGGNGTWSRSEYAEVVADELKLSKANILRMTRSECKSAWAHTFVSPEDISMNSSKLEEKRGEKNMSLREGIRDMIEKKTLVV